MKKGLKIATASFLAVSALVPVTAFAAEQTTAADGFYTATKFYTTAEFQALSPAEKKAIIKEGIKSKSLVIVMGGKVFDTSNIAVLTATDATFESTGITYEAFVASGKDLSKTGGIVTPKPPVTGELKVESVSAINSKQIEVKFSDKVLKSSIVEAGVAPAADTLVDNVVTLTKTGSSVTNLTTNTAEAKLSTDGKTLTITLVAAEELENAKYILSIAKDSVLTEDGKKLSAYTTTINSNDTTAPTVTKGEYNPASGYIEVTFSEPTKTNAPTGVVAPSVVRVNGVPYTAGTAGTSPLQGQFAAKSAHEGETVYYINAGTNVAPGTTASVYVAGAVDAAGNHQTSYNGSITRPADASALVATSVTQQGSNVVRVEFNKALATSGAASLQAGLSVFRNTVEHKNGTAGTTFTVTKVASDSTGRTFDIALSLTGASSPNFGIYSGLTQELTFVIAKDSLTDVFGNKNSVNTTTLTFNKDINAPKVTTTRLSADKKSIELLFDKDLDTTIAAGNIAIRHDGVDIAASNWSALVDTTNKKLLRVSATAAGAIADAVSGELKPGSYAVRLNDAAVKDAFGNANVATNPAPVTVASSNTNPKLSATIASTSATNSASVFTVTFKDATGTNTKVKDSALNHSNYLLDGQPLPTSADIVFTSAAKEAVTITLSKNTINIGSTATSASALLTVKDVQNLAGDVVKTVSSAVDVKDNTAAKLQSATLVSGTNTLVLTFDENVAGTYAAVTNLLTDFDILGGTLPFDPGTAAGVATVTTAVSGKTLTIVVVPAATGANDNWSTIKAASTITVKAKEDGTTGLVTTLKDANGAGVVSGTSVTVNKQ